MASDDWIDALERLDLIFDDFTDVVALVDRLDTLLGRPASTEQIRQTIEVLGLQKMQAAEQGLSIDRFTRAGKVITQLRDRFGRFVTSGAHNIAERLARGGG